MTSHLVLPPLQPPCGLVSGRSEHVGPLTCSDLKHIASLPCLSKQWKVKELGDVQRAVWRNHFLGLRAEQVEVWQACKRALLVAKGIRADGTGAMSYAEYRTLRSSRQEGDRRAAQGAADGAPQAFAFMMDPDRRRRIDGRGGAAWRLRSVGPRRADVGLARSRTRTGRRSARVVTNGAESGGSGAEVARVGSGDESDDMHCRRTRARRAVAVILSDDTGTESETNRHGAPDRGGAVTKKRAGRGKSNGQEGRTELDGPSSQGQARWW